MNGDAARPGMHVRPGLGRPQLDQLTVRICVFGDHLRVQGPRW